jgi:hypothetical protein
MTTISTPARRPGAPLDDLRAGRGAGRLRPFLLRSPGAAAYLLVSFPLAVAGFGVVTVGLAASVGLVAVVAGVPLLALTLLAGRALSQMERWLAWALLGAERPAPLDPGNGGQGVLGALWANLRRAAGWRAAADQVIRLAVTTVTFTGTVVVLAVGLGLALAPAWYGSGALHLGGRTVDSLGFAMALVPVGLALLAGAAPLVVAVAALQHRLSRSVTGGA